MMRQQMKSGDGLKQPKFKAACLCDGTGRIRVSIPFVTKGMAHAAGRPEMEGKSRGPSEFPCPIHVSVHPQTARGRGE